MKVIPICSHWIRSQQHHSQSFLCSWNFQGTYFEMPLGSSTFKTWKWWFSIVRWPNRAFLDQTWRIKAKIRLQILWTNSRCDLAQRLLRIAQRKSVPLQKSKSDQEIFQWELWEQHSKRLHHTQKHNRHGVQWTQRSQASRLRGGFLQWEVMRLIAYDSFSWVWEVKKESPLAVGDK